MGNPAGSEAENPLSSPKQNRRKARPTLRRPSELAAFLPSVYGKGVGTVSWGPGPLRVAAAGGLGCGALTLLPVAQHVLSRAQTISLPHLCNVLLAFARLNFRPEQEEPFFSLVRSPHPPVPSSFSLQGWGWGVWIVCGITCSPACWLCGPEQAFELGFL